MTVLLVPMAEPEFEAYLQPAIRNYANEKTKSGIWKPEDAQQRSEREFQRFLPLGLATPNTFFYTIRLTESGENVGMIWVSAEERGGRKMAFVYDFIVAEEHRRHGYGEQAFRELETKMREVGLLKIGLHVFGFNHGARALYTKLGYIETDVTMVKRLD